MGRKSTQPEEEISLGTAEENPGKKISSSQVHSCPALSGSFLAAPYSIF